MDTLEKGPTAFFVSLRRTRFTLLSRIRYVPITSPRKFGHVFSKALCRLFWEVPTIKLVSYINVKDYSSPKDLRKYLQKINKNYTIYNEYFEWKENYTCSLEVPGFSPFCQVYKMMHKNRNKNNIIPGINKF